MEKISAMDGLSERIREFAATPAGAALIGAGVGGAGGAAIGAATGSKEDRLKRALVGAGVGAGVGGGTGLGAQHLLSRDIGGAAPTLRHSEGDVFLFESPGGQRYLAPSNEAATEGSKLLRYIPHGKSI